MRWFVIVPIQSAAIVHLPISACCVRNVNVTQVTWAQSGRAHRRRAAIRLDNLERFHRGKAWSTATREAARVVHGPQPHLVARESPPSAHALCDAPEQVVFILSLLVLRLTLFHQLANLAASQPVSLPLCRWPDFSIGFCVVVAFVSAGGGVDKRSSVPISLGVAT
jgi:hypothetical protein